MLAATLLTTAALLTGGSFPETFPVPAGSQPEGIASGKGTTLYVGSRANGSVYRADARTGRGAVLVPGQPGRGAFGLKRRGGALYVAGGPTGFGYVYDARTGANRGAHDFDGQFVNDVVVTRKAAYFTDSNKPFLYVWPRGRRAGEPYALPITGDFVYGEGLNANGIAAARGGRTLILVASATGALYTADARTGVTKRIDAPPVVNGDGLLLRGRTLHVVQNRLNKIAVLRLDRRLTRARLVTELTDPDFDVPTTIAALGRRLYAVNARFSSPQTPETTYDVVKVG
jgi:sugar lactone lactonase YvrE